MKQYKLFDVNRSNTTILIDEDEIIDIVYDASAQAFHVETIGKNYYTNHVNVYGYCTINYDGIIKRDFSLVCEYFTSCYRTRYGAMYTHYYKDGESIL